MMTTIVTGAANGIGRAIAQRCAEQGHTVLACDIDMEALSRISGGNVHTFRLDVSDHGAVCAFFEQIRPVEGGSLALVNNAGIYLGRGLTDYTPADIDRVLDVNIKGAVYCSRQFALLVRGRRLRGRIVNLSSVSGQEGSSDAVYGLTKAALIGLTKSCAMSLAPDILVNAVAPTVVETAMMDAIPQWRREEYAARNLIPAPVTADDVAATVLFLLSDAASHYTGATFDLNNGGYLR